jgi:peptidoglycan/LPS O-acetylase OafA/YrhL
MTAPRDLAAHRINGLDGIRTPFLFAVITGHVFQWGFAWVALPFFFVMSSFLITRILLADREAEPRPGALFVRFYARRSLRIFPILYLYVLVVGAFALYFDAFASVKP